MELHHLFLLFQQQAEAEVLQVVMRQIKMLVLVDQAGVVEVTMALVLEVLEQQDKGMLEQMELTLVAHGVMVEEAALDQLEVNLQAIM